MQSSQHIHGFTIIELIIVMTLGGIIFTVLAGIITRPFSAYPDLIRRAKLTDIASTTITNMTQDIHQALPNSIRVKTESGRTAIELLNIAEAFRYRVGALGVNDLDNLSFTAADTDFNVFGDLENLTLGVQPANIRLVVYNTGDFTTTTDNPTAGSNVYAAANPGPPTSHVITPAGTTITTSVDGNETHFNLSAGFLFSQSSPDKRLYAIDNPVSYVCDPSAGTLTRYTGYTFGAVQPTDGTAAPLSGGSSALVAEHLESCAFIYAPGTFERAALVTLELVLLEAGERIRLLHQVHIGHAL